MNETRRQINKITGMGIILALVVIFQFINNYVPIGFLPFNLALFPIALGSFLFGPWAGLLFGVIDGLLILAAPSTQAIFASYNLFATILLCLGKTGLAGLASGFIFKAFEKKHPMVGAVIGSLAVPFINTGIFYIVTYLIFAEPIMALLKMSDDAGLFIAIGVYVIGVNFFIEALVNGALSPIIYKLYSLYIKKHPIE